MIYDASLGNPFFVTETTRSLLRSASVEVDEHRGRLVRLQPTLRPRTAVVHRFFQIGSTEANVARSSPRSGACRHENSTWSLRSPAFPNSG